MQIRLFQCPQFQGFTAFALYRTHRTRKNITYYMGILNKFISDVGIISIRKKAFIWRKKMTFSETNIF